MWTSIPKKKKHTFSQKLGIQWIQTSEVIKPAWAPKVRKTNGKPACWVIEISASGPRHRCRWSPQSRGDSAAIPRMAPWHRIQISGLHRVHILLFIPEAKRGTMWYHVVPEDPEACPLGFQRMGIPWSSNVFTYFTIEVMGKFWWILFGVMSCAIFGHHFGTASGWLMYPCRQPLFVQQLLWKKSCPSSSLCSTSVPTIPILDQTQQRNSLMVPKMCKSPTSAIVPGGIIHLTILSSAESLSSDLFSSWNQAPIPQPGPPRNRRAANLACRTWSSREGPDLGPRLGGWFSDDFWLMFLRWFDCKKNAQWSYIHLHPRLDKWCSDILGQLHQFFGIFATSLFPGTRQHSEIWWCSPRFTRSISWKRLYRSFPSNMYVCVCVYYVYNKIW